MKKTFEASDTEKDDDNDYQPESPINSDHEPQFREEYSDPKVNSGTLTLMILIKKKKLTATRVALVHSAVRLNLLILSVNSQG